VERSGYLYRGYQRHRRPGRRRIHVTVTDANGCEATATYTVVQDIQTLSIVEDITSTICTAEIGAITITVTGGTEPYTYLWSGPDTFTADTKDIADLAAGEYIVTVTDANGCEVTATYTVVQDTNTLTIEEVITSTICTAETEPSPLPSLVEQSLIPTCGAVRIPLPPIPKTSQTWLPANTLLPLPMPTAVRLQQPTQLFRTPTP
jgi:hypothetical protein